MWIRFWGTRGSIAKAGPGTVRYGGNTSCVEVRTAAGTLVVLDCGTGLHGLGRALVAERDGGIRGHILVTHTHWDHTQGLPFFEPLARANAEWDIYGPCTPGTSTREVLAGQMHHAYFPVTLAELPATIRYHDLVEGTFEIDDIRITTQYLHHPALTLGYRLEADGVTLVYATDHEPHSRQLALGFREASPEDRRHAAFLAGADLVIHDAQYTAREYPSKIGWGHSTVEYVVDVARAMEVRRVALFHHDPLRGDDDVDRLVQDARSRAGASAAVEILAAAEGLLLELKPKAQPDAGIRPSRGSALADVTLKLADQPVLIAVKKPKLARALSEAVQADGFRLLAAKDGHEAIRLAREARPSLLVLDRQLPDADGLDVCRGLRSDESPVKDVPIVLVADEKHLDRRAGAEAGVTDWLVTPFSGTYARTRMHAWVLRASLPWAPALIPEDEEVRIRALRQLRILDTRPEERFDRLTRLAAVVFKVPIALISLVDADRQWFKSCYGLDVRETPREVGFCAHTILGDGPMVIPDARQDPRFAENPLVTAEPFIRFYAGVPLVAADGSRIGTLCLIDHEPRPLDDQGMRLLGDLAALVQRELVAPRQPS